MNSLICLIGALVFQAPTRPGPPLSQPRSIVFSGEEWTVKHSEGRVGPGPNYFSDSAANVFVDEQGRLHLKITFRDGQWRCAEVVSKKSFGYGTYRFDIAASTQLDPRAVWGLFTWNDRDPAYSHREIDIEFSLWGDAKSMNSQFVVQPYTHPQNRHRFTTPADLDDSTHLFNWRPDRILFQSAKSSVNASRPDDVIADWTYRGADLPEAGGENLRINLWLFGGTPPADGKEIEVIVRRFVFSGPAQVTRSTTLNTTGSAR